MKSQRLGLQPINNYERVVNPRKKRFHMSSRMNSHGKILLLKLPIMRVIMLKNLAC